MLAERTKAYNNSYKAFKQQQKHLEKVKSENPSAEFESGFKHQANNLKGFDKGLSRKSKIEKPYQKYLSKVVSREAKAEKAFAEVNDLLGKRDALTTKQNELAVQKSGLQTTLGTLKNTRKNTHSHRRKKLFNSKIKETEKKIKSLDKEITKNQEKLNPIQAKLEDAIDEAKDLRKFAKESREALEKLKENAEAKQEAKKYGRKIKQKDLPNPEVKSFPDPIGRTAVGKGLKATAEVHKEVATKAPRLLAGSAAKEFTRLRRARARGKFHRTLAKDVLLLHGKMTVAVVKAFGSLALDGAIKGFELQGKAIGAGIDLATKGGKAAHKSFLEAGTPKESRENVHTFPPGLKARGRKRADSEPDNVADQEQEQERGPAPRPGPPGGGGQ